LFVIIISFAEKWWGWTMPNPLYFFIIIFVFIFIASFMVWKDEQQKRIDLENQLKNERDNKVPKLFSDFDVFAVAPAGENGIDSIVTILPTIRNTGAPSIVTNIGITIKRNNLEIKGKDVILSRGDIRLEGDGLKLALKEEDNFSKKGISNPIPTGGALSGWHVVLVRNITSEKIHDKNTIIIFSYKDVVGKIYTQEKTMNYTTEKLIVGTELQKSIK
jgi:hypothetical protein